MPLIQKRKTTRSDLKWFGLIVAACFGILGAISRLRGHPAAADTLWIIGGAMTVMYYALPPVQPLIYDIWMGITYPIGWAVSHLMLIIMFFGIITPVAVVMRLFGRDPLHRTFDRSSDDYWVLHDPGTNADRYFWQY